MGAGGLDSSENDDALDWLADFCDDPEESVILAALKTATDAGEDDQLELPECAAAVAAAEIVAVLKGATDAEVPEDVKACLASSHIKPERHLVEAALRALARIRSDSEMKEVWDESEGAGEWYDAVGDLESRLRK